MSLQLALKCLMLFAVFPLNKGTVNFCSESYYPIAGKCYRFYQVARSWLNAEETCRQDGADLASVTTELQYTGLLQHINTHYAGQYWTSGKLNGRSWIWTNNGQGMSSQWFGRTPATSGNYCAYFCSYTHKYWDGSCRLAKKFICEKLEEQLSVSPEIQISEQNGW